MMEVIRVRPKQFGLMPLNEYINKRIYPVSITSYVEFNDDHYKVQLSHEVKPIIVWKEDIDCLMNDQNTLSQLPNGDSVTVGDNFSGVINVGKDAQNVDIKNTQPPSTSRTWIKPLNVLIGKAAQWITRGG